MVSTRTRFEVLKRDGFRCRYCGAQGFDAILHVDHVIPSSEGGTGDPANLVAACSNCNLGKSNVPLSESRLTSSPTEAMLEHAEQIRAQLYAQRELDESRTETCEYLASHWRTMMGGDPLVIWFNSLRNVLRVHSVETVVEAIDILAAVVQSRGYMNDTSRVKYFHGILRRRAEGQA